MAQLYIKVAPKGVDIPVQRAQGIIYSQLRAIWCSQLSADGDYKCYPRIESVPESGDGKGTVPAAAKINGEYDIALPDDTAKLVSFFGLDTRTSETAGWMHRVNGHLVFFAKTCALEDNGYRADEEVRRHVYSVLQTLGCGFKFTEQVTGIDNVLREYRGFSTHTGLYNFDLGTWHCFRFNFELVYDPLQ